MRAFASVSAQSAYRLELARKMNLFTGIIVSKA